MMTTAPLIDNEEGNKNCMSKTSFGKRLTKYAFIFINLLLMVIAIPVVYFSNKDIFVETFSFFDWFIGEYFTHLTDVYVLINGFIFFAGIKGIFYAIIESPRLLNLSGALYVIAFIFNFLISGGLVFSTITGISNLEDMFGEFMRHYEYYDSAQKRVDWMQNYFSCCGLYGSSDWRPYLNADSRFDYIEHNNVTIPRSCCPDYLDSIDCSYVVENGCYFKARSFFLTITVFVLIISGLITALTAIGIMLAFRLRTKIIKSKNVINLPKTITVATIMPSEKINCSGLQSVSSEQRY